MLLLHDLGLLHDLRLQHDFRLQHDMRLLHDLLPCIIRNPIHACGHLCGGLRHSKASNVLQHLLPNPLLSHGRVGLPDRLLSRCLGRLPDRLLSRRRVRVGVHVEVCVVRPTMCV